jgi:hypothetical protein
MKELIKNMLSDEKGQISATRVAGFISLFSLIVFAGAAVVAAIVWDAEVPDFVIWGLVSVVVSLFTGAQVAKFTGAQKTKDKTGSSEAL